MSHRKPTLIERIELLRMCDYEWYKIFEVLNREWYALEILAFISIVRQREIKEAIGESQIHHATRMYSYFMNGIEVSKALSQPPAV